MVKESVVAKSIGDQKEQDIQRQDQVLYDYLRSGKKIPKDEANYREQQTDNISQRDRQEFCETCRFNLPTERMCHIVEGEVNNENGVSKYFSPKGEGMLPGDIVWDYIKKTGKKLNFENGHVINKSVEGYQCKDCKYYMYSHSCLLIKGRLEPEMSCAIIVKRGSGIEV